MEQRESHVKLNPFCHIRFGERPSCQLLLNETSLELPDKRYIPLLLRLSNPTSRNAVAELAGQLLGVGPAKGAAVVADLEKNQILVNADAPFPRTDAVDFWMKRGWLEGLIFHLETRNLEYEDADGHPKNGEDVVAQRLRESIEREGPPSFWKSYPEARSVDLPAPNVPASPEPLAQSLLRRRSNTTPRNKSMSQEQLSTMLHYGSLENIRLRQQAERTLKTHPENLVQSSFSAIETYFVAFNVEGLEPGLYHYEMPHHRVALVNPEVVRQNLSKMCFGQTLASAGPCTFLFTGVWQRYMYRYRHARAYRNLLVNMAELGQRYLLMATALGFSTFMTPQTLYHEAQRILGVPHYEEGLLYVIGAG